MHPQQTQLAELLGQLPGERAGLEPVGHVGQDLVADEAPHGVAEQQLVGVEQTIQRQHVARVHLMGQWLVTHARSVPASHKMS